MIKNFVDPAELKVRLPRLGWDCEIRRDGSDWVYGEARAISASHTDQGPRHEHEQ